MGFHVGPAVAGVIGTRKFTYDLWGEAVNLASRLQTASHPGRVLVSAAVRERLDQWFEFEARGRVELKGFGLQPAWYLLGPRRSDRSAGGPPPAGR
jgi:adenylate cyclase